MLDFEEQLEREEQMMGRSCTYIAGWAFEGRERHLRVMIYETAPWENIPVELPPEIRWVVWTDAGQVTGGVVGYGLHRDS